MIILGKIFLEYQLNTQYKKKRKERKKEKKRKKNQYY
jgi:hypothetical protein